MYNRKQESERKQKLLECYVSVNTQDNLMDKLTNVEKVGKKIGLKQFKKKKKNILIYHVD